MGPKSALSHPEVEWTGIQHALKIYLKAAYHFKQNKQDPAAQDFLKRAMQGAHGLDRAIAIIETDDENLRWVKSFLQKFLTKLRRNPFQQASADKDPLFTNTGAFKNLKALSGALVGRQSGYIPIPIDHTFYPLRHTPGLIIRTIIEASSPSIARKEITQKDGILDQVLGRVDKKTHNPFFDADLLEFKRDPLIKAAPIAPEDKTPTAASGTRPAAQPAAAWGPERGVAIASGNGGGTSVDYAPAAAPKTATKRGPVTSPPLPPRTSSKTPASSKEDGSPTKRQRGALLAPTSPPPAANLESKSTNPQPVPAAPKAPAAPPPPKPKPKVAIAFKRGGKAPSKDSRRAPTR